MTEFEKIRDSVVNYIRQVEASAYITNLRGTIDERISKSSFSQKDLGLEDYAVVDPGYDGGYGEDIQKQITRLETNKSEEKTEAKRFIQRFLGGGYYGYAKLRNMLGMPLESPVVRWWNSSFINPLIAFINPGGKVTIREGEYTITDVITDQSKNSVSLEGMGPSTILTLANAVDKAVLSISSVNDWTIESMKIDGNKANQSGGTRSGIYMNVVDTSMIRDVRVHDTYLDGIEWNSSERVITQNCHTIDTGQYGIDQDDCDYTLAVQNIVYGTDTFAGIESSGIRDSVIHGNIVINAATDGIHIKGSDASGDTYRNIVSNNRVQNAGQYGIYVTDYETKLAYYNEVIGNQVHQSDKAGIFSNTRRTLIIGNRSTENGQGGGGEEYGIHNTKLGAVIVGNVCSDYQGTKTQTHGIYNAGADAAQCMIFMNNVRLNDTVGIYCDYQTGTLVRYNIGYVTENNGTGSILNTTTSLAVAHGCDYTPAAEDVSIVGKENPTNDVGTIWVDTFGAANFTVNVENDPGASNWDFGWHVIKN